MRGGAAECAQAHPVDIIADCERGAQAVESDERIARRSVFDRLGLSYFSRR
jgi:hypothetical protein